MFTLNEVGVFKNDYDYRRSNTKRKIICNVDYSEDVFPEI